MADHSITSIPAGTPIPDDDPGRRLTVTDTSDPAVPRISLVGDTYTVLVSGDDTDGRYTLIDMVVPDGSGPPPHRHDFEEMFTLLDGELEFTFRGATRTVRAPQTVNIPANAPHRFVNASGSTVHMLCMCTPAGQEELFEAVGVPIEDPQAGPPRVSEEERARKGELAASLMAKYRTVMVESA